MPSLRTPFRRFVAITPILLAAIAACSKDVPSLPAITAAAHDSAWTAWKATRAKWVLTPGRPLSYTGLRWLKPGPNTIGADASNDVLLQGRDAPAKLGVLTRDGTTISFEPAAGIAATIDSQAAVAGRLRADVDSGGASTVRTGSAGFRVMRRVDSVGVRTFDADRVTPEAAAKTIAPLSYFPIDMSWRVPGKLVPFAKPDTQAVPTSSGIPEVHIIVGRVAAIVGGAPVSLTAMVGTGPKDLYFTFSDETSGEETYGFRFLHAALDTATKIVTLDFNFAYNPDCAFSGFTTCPLPPTENRIPVKITAGEKIVVHIDGDSSHVARAKVLQDKVKAGIGAGAKASVRAKDQIVPKAVAKP